MDGATARLPEKMVTVPVLKSAVLPLYLPLINEIKKGKDSSLMFPENDILNEVAAKRRRRG